MPRPLRRNPILRTDSYKLTHWRQYPKDTEFIVSYLESRGGMFNRTQQVGAQYYTQSYLEGEVFTQEHVEHARAFCRKHFGNDFCFNYAGWTSLRKKHGGRLPLRIRAIPEGHLVEGHNALVTVENTDPEFYWLTNWAETLLLKIWNTISVATQAREIRQIIGRALVRTGDPKLVDFALHDFGYRGVSSEETAALGGFAHLINFHGTDNPAGIELAQQFYKADMPGIAPPASEHSTITTWGQENEGLAYKNMLDQYPEGLVACVSDSYDIYNAVSNLWGGLLRDRVMERKGTLVIRPDSGDPVTVLENVFNALWEKFGGEVNAKGWKVLSPCVRVIQGDGVNYHTIQNMISQLTRKGWSMDNFCFGMGGALLQQLNRDTLRFAFKCSAIRRAGVWHDVHKDPKTDPTKASKGGRFYVSRSSGKFTTIPIVDDKVIQVDDQLHTIFLNGDVTEEYTLDEIRKRSQTYDDFRQAA
jgi:nicotinamide phosphoribosyltransferase